RSDSVICLPGGVGTWEEFFESLTWNQLGLQSKPIVLLNIEDYYSTLAEFIEHSVLEGFLPRSTASELIFVDSIPAAIEHIENYIPKDKSNWFKRLQE
ncbi:MAG TPA: LOG family protein, partial [Gammaproteobacteria bacterium]|nr:LOG family protein [Gammaproteobacteria bacterium]